MLGESAVKTPHDDQNQQCVLKSDGILEDEGGSPLMKEHLSVEETSEDLPPVDALKQEMEQGEKELDEGEPLSIALVSEPIIDEELNNEKGGGIGEDRDNGKIPINIEIEEGREEELEEEEGETGERGSVCDEELLPVDTLKQKMEKGKEELDEELLPVDTPNQEMEEGEEELNEELLPVDTLKQEMEEGEEELNEELLPVDTLKQEMEEGEEELNETDLLPIASVSVPVIKEELNEEEGGDIDDGNPMQFASVTVAIKEEIEEGKEEELEADKEKKKGSVRATPRGRRPKRRIFNFHKRRAPSTTEVVDGIEETLPSSISDTDNNNGLPGASGDSTSDMGQLSQRRRIPARAAKTACIDKLVGIIFDLNNSKYRHRLSQLRPYERKRQNADSVEERGQRLLQIRQSERHFTGQESDQERQQCLEVLRKRARQQIAQETSEEMMQRIRNLQERANLGPMVLYI